MIKPMQRARNSTPKQIGPGHNWPAQGPIARGEHYHRPKCSPLGTNSKRAGARERLRRVAAFVDPRSLWQPVDAVADNCSPDNVQRHEAKSHTRAGSAPNGRTFGANKMPRDLANVWEQSISRCQRWPVVAFSWRSAFTPRTKRSPSEKKRGTKSRFGLRRPILCALKLRRPQLERGTLRPENTKPLVRVGQLQLLPSARKRRVSFCMLPLESCTN